jgi:phospholipid/cholesterol/gamma-HCH transport system permease protein
MDKPADFSLKETSEASVAELTGDWTAILMGEANERLESVLRDRPRVTVDMSHIGRCDTSGAFGILKASKLSAGPVRYVASPAVNQLLELVENALKAEPTPHRTKRPFYDLFDRIGHGVVNLGIDAFDTMVFMGHLLVAVGRAIANPMRVRWAPCIALAERAGLDALPIITTTTFFMGAVVALLGSNMLQTFGAKVYVVGLVGWAVLREFNALITAIILAGRSGSSFAAEIGAMKMNQEIDAMQVMGVDPFDALVFPRFFALFVTVPLLTFAATIAGLAGGLLVCWSQLGLGPTFFFQQLLNTVGAKHFWVGMSKMPVMAVVIAGIGCRQGMEVGGDVESLGRRVTASVVHALFATILIDALFATVYMKLDI